MLNHAKISIDIKNTRHFTHIQAAYHFSFAHLEESGQVIIYILNVSIAPFLKLVAQIVTVLGYTFVRKTAI